MAQVQLSTTSGMPSGNGQNVICPPENVYLFFHIAELALLDCTFSRNVGAKQGQVGSIALMIEKLQEWDHYSMTSSGNSKEECSCVLMKVTQIMLTESLTSLKMTKAYSSPILFKNCSCLDVKVQKKGPSESTPKYSYITETLSTIWMCYRMFCFISHCI